MQTSQVFESRKFRDHFKSENRKVEGLLQEMYELLQPLFAIKVFGSSRLHESDPTYQNAQRLGQFICEAGGGAMTGGGPGIMEAVPRGTTAGEAALQRRSTGTPLSNHLRSIGLNLNFLREPPNPHLTYKVTVANFLIRVAGFNAYGQGTACFDGGWGTFLEHNIVDERIDEIKRIRGKKQGTQQADIVPFLGLIGPHFKYYESMKNELSSLGVSQATDFNGEHFDVGFSEGPFEGSSFSDKIRKAQAEWSEIRKKAGKPIMPWYEVPSELKEQLHENLKNIQESEEKISKIISEGFKPLSSTYTFLIGGGDYLKKGQTPEGDAYLDQAEQLAYCLTLQKIRVICFAEIDKRNLPIKPHDQDPHIPRSNKALIEKVKLGHKKALAELKERGEEISPLLRKPPDEVFPTAPSLMPVRTRLRVITALANGFFMLPGGLRSITEISYILQLAQLGISAKSKNEPLDLGLRFESRASQESNYIPPLIIPKQGMNFLTEASDIFHNRQTAFRREVPLERLSVSEACRAIAESEREFYATSA